MLLEICCESYREFALEVFDIVLFVIEFSLGSQHYIFSEAFLLMASFFLAGKLLDDAKTMHQSRVVCLLSAIG